MQYKILKVQTYNYVQIYLTEQELYKEETKELINKYKNLKYKIGIFVTGKQNYPEVLNEIVTKEVDLYNNEF